MYNMHHKLQIFACIVLLSQVQTTRAMEINNYSPEQDRHKKSQGHFPRSRKFKAKILLEDIEDISSENNKKVITMVYCILGTGETFKETFNRTSSPTIKVKNK